MVASTTSCVSLNGSPGTTIAVSKSSFGGGAATEVATSPAERTAAAMRARAAQVLSDMSLPPREDVSSDALRGRHGQVPAMCWQEKKPGQIVYD